MTLRELLADACKKCGDFTAAELLLLKAFQLTREQFWIRRNDFLKTPESLKLFNCYLKRFLRGEPVAYIIEEREFFGVNFFVKRGALIPRPETELIVEKALQLDVNQKKVLDIGAGCGCIAISIALNSSARLFALEKSKRALRILKINIKKFNLQRRVQIISADLFPPQRIRFDLIVSNPPYISETDWNNLPLSITAYEPKCALLAKERGLFFYKKILSRAGFYLNDQGSLLIEAGYNQQQELNNLARKSGWKVVSWENDINGIARVVHLKRE